jgi:hypothetical protein
MKNLIVIAVCACAGLIAQSAVAYYMYEQTQPLAKVGDWTCIFEQQFMSSLDAVDQAKVIDSLGNRIPAECRPKK